MKQSHICITSSQKHTFRDAMDFITRCINTFLTPENIKNYIEYMIDNNIFLTDESHDSLIGIIINNKWHRRFKTHFAKNDGTFYDAIIHILIHETDKYNKVGLWHIHRDVCNDEIFDTLCKYPEFVEHVKFICGCSKDDVNEMWQKIVRKSCERDNECKPAKKMSNNDEQQNIDIHYYDLAFHDFLQYDNMKQYLFYILENPDACGRRLLCDYLYDGTIDDGNNPVRYFQTECRWKWFILHDNSILHTTFYHMFAKLWHIERDEMKNALVCVQEQTYDGFAENYNNDGNGNISGVRVFADDYIVRHIYNFL